MPVRLNRLTFAPIATCLILLAQSSVAETITYSSGPFDAELSIDADESGDFSFGMPTAVSGLPQFDPALGTLTEVTFAITSGTFDWEATLDGEPSGDIPFELEFDAFIQADVAYIFGGFASVLAGTSDSINLFCSGDPTQFDGCFDANGNNLDFLTFGFSFPRPANDFAPSDIIGTGEIQNLALQINLDGASFIVNEGMDFFFVSGIATVADANIEVTYTYDAGTGIDTDEDGVPDDADNCTEAANPGQEDADADGHGNACDGDFDNTCLVNFLDLSTMKAGFLTADPELDLDSSGLVNFADLAILKSLFLLQPGPSAPGALCNSDQG